MLKYWTTHTHTAATGLSQRSNVPSGQSRCFPDPWPQTLLWLWDSIFGLLSTLSTSPMGTDLPSATLGVTLSATQEQLHWEQKMPLLWKILCKRTKYSHHICKSDFILLAFLITWSSIFLISSKTLFYRTICFQLIHSALMTDCPICLIITQCDPFGTRLLVKPKSKAAGGNDTFTQVEHFSNGAEKVELIAIWNNFH